MRRRSVGSKLYLRARIYRQPVRWRGVQSVGLAALMVTVGNITWFPDLSWEHHLPPIGECKCISQKFESVVEVQFMLDGHQMCQRRSTVENTDV